MIGLIETAFVCVTLITIAAPRFGRLVAQDEQAIRDPADRKRSFEEGRRILERSRKDWVRLAVETKTPRSEGDALEELDNRLIELAKEKGGL